MNDERQTLIIVPTELERADNIVDIGLLALPVLAIWWTYNNFGLTAALVMVVPAVLCWIYALSGEPLSDVRYIGAFASSVRHRFGWRRANEWLLAIGHFWYVAVWPIWQARYEHQVGPNLRHRFVVWLIHGCPRCYAERHLHAA